MVAVVHVPPLYVQHFPQLGHGDFYLLIVVEQRHVEGVLGLVVILFAQRELLHDEYGILENGLHACSKNPASAAGAAIWKRYLEIAAANPHTDWRKVCDSLWTLAKIRCEVEKNGKMPSLIAEMIRNPQLR